MITPPDSGQAGMTHTSFFDAMTKILIATGNQGKFREIMEVLGDLPIEFVTLADLGLVNNVEETGDTYEENAYLKAEAFFAQTGIPTIAEDSGLEVTALRGELGVKTRRWGAGENASDKEWLDFFLRCMETEADRSATFHCVAAFVDGDTRQSFHGSTPGILTKEPQCDIPHGIPVSALFIPEGHSLVYAAMSPTEKNQVSHRGKAMHQLKEFLKQRV